MDELKAKTPFLRLPVVSLNAEYLVMGHLMRRNILAFKAPPNNEGYDIICIHPGPKKVTKQILVQVKSRYQTDCDRGFPVKEKSIDSFGYLVVAFLNIGYFSASIKKGQHSSIGRQEPAFYTFPAALIRQHHKKESAGWEKVRTKDFDIAPFKNGPGFELIANELQVPVPTK